MNNILKSLILILSITLFLPSSSTAAEYKYRIRKQLCSISGDCPTSSSGSSSSGGSSSGSSSSGGGNAPPLTMSEISDQSETIDTTVGPLNFTITDPLNDPASLTLTKNSSNTTLLPVSGIVLGGGGTNRTITITPAMGEIGTSTVTITASGAGRQNGSLSFDFSIFDSTPAEFTSTGTEENYIIPPGVIRLKAQLWAGGGGNAGGGGGGYSEGEINVTPGQSLTIMVGGKGAATAGGWPGGGTGGAGAWTNGGGGGGMSAIKRGSNSLLIAGGGGGGAGNGGAGGPGGGYSGVSGNPGGGTNCWNNGTAGTAGSQTAGGTSGGGALQGGSAAYANYHGAGGGGGGYFGGGAGVGGFAGSNCSAGGGGGGSAYTGGAAFNLTIAGTGTLSGGSGQPGNPGNAGNAAQNGYAILTPVALGNNSAPEIVTPSGLQMFYRNTLFIPISVADENDPLDDLITTATSSNQIDIPDSSISVIRSGSQATDNFRVLLTNPPAFGSGESATITVTIRDPHGASATNTFTAVVEQYQGADISYTVPTGVTSMHAQLWGAGGGVTGGGGGYVEGNIATTPGETLTLQVGGKGATTAGGWPGAGNGGTGGWTNGGGGGGMSTIKRNATYLAIAGGGGGGAGNGGTGGPGGGYSGVNGNPGGGTNCWNNGTAGTAGTQTAGGSTGGGALQGGGAAYANYHGAGGGGSGYFGGGAGVGGFAGSNCSAGGGGGGSSYTGGLSDQLTVAATGTTPGGTDRPGYPSGFIGRNGQHGFIILTPISEMANSAPVITTPSGMQYFTRSGLSIPFTIADANDSLDSLQVGATSNNQTDIPNSTISVVRNGSQETNNFKVVLTNPPAFGLGHPSTITITATDPHSASSSASFIASVEQYQGTDISYTVPAGVTSMYAQLWGAGGGVAGGGGGYVEGNIATTPGETLTLQVGGKGVATAGGWPGGGNGGAGGWTNGGGGGGMSAIKRGSNYLLIAGGGGGGASNGGAGGPGGGYSGVNGNPGGGTNCWNNGTAGTAGTQTAGGSTGGGALQGGGAAYANYHGAGGGGSGYFGGGAGVGGFAGSNCSAGGGGGGSGYVDASITVPYLEAGFGQNAAGKGEANYPDSYIGNSGQSGFIALTPN